MCPGCGVQLSGRRVQCGQPECWRIWQNARMRSYWADRPGQRQSKRPLRSCPTCGVERRSRGAGFCRPCAAKIATGARSAQAHRERAERHYPLVLVGPALRVTRPPAKPRRTWWKLIIVGPCGHCGSEMTRKATSPQTAPVYCSKRCARAATKHRRGRRHAPGRLGVSRRSIFERDGWRCGVCHRAVDSTLRAPHPLSASLDHIIPLAAGGHHIEANVQLAHFLCNSRKGAVGPGQLRLAI
jgi:5-methylcytosine-specific restriction endonuclease McrA